jgi:hypothetical protein
MKTHLFGLIEEPAMNKPIRTHSKQKHIYYSRLLRSLHIFKSGTLFLMAAAYLVATLSLLFNPALRQMERSPNLENEPVTVVA